MSKFGSIWLAYGISLNPIRYIYKHALYMPIIMVSQMTEAPLLVKPELQTYIDRWPMDPPHKRASNAETSAKGVSYGRYNLYLFQHVPHRKRYGVKWNISFEGQYIMRCYSITSPQNICSPYSTLLVIINVVYRPSSCVILKIAFKYPACVNYYRQGNIFLPYVIV